VRVDLGADAFELPAGLELLNEITEIFVLHC
jgi:hypothetical protein